MSKIEISENLPRRLDVNRFSKNGDEPQAAARAFQTRQMNHVLRYRRKEVFRYASRIGTPTSGTRYRWRFRCHTGTLTKYLRVAFVADLGRQGVASSSVSMGCTLTLTAVGGGTNGVATIKLSRGILEGGSLIQSNSGSSQAIAVDPDKTYEGVFHDSGYGSLYSAVVFEEAEAPDTDNGYLAQSYAVQGPIYDSHRSDLMVASTDAWRANAAHCFNWCVDEDATKRSMTSATAKNLIDDTSTTVSAATPGFYADLRYANRRSKTTVPCVFAAYGAVSSAGGCEVLLKDDTGTIVATVSIPYDPAWAWVETTVNLPATDAKYDVHYRRSSGVGTVEIGACSLYQYLAP